MLLFFFGDGEMRRRAGVVPRGGFRDSRIYRDWHYFRILLLITVLCRSESCIQVYKEYDHDVTVISLWNQPSYVDYSSRQSPPRTCMMRTWFHPCVVEELGQCGFDLAVRLSFVAGILEQLLSFISRKKKIYQAPDVDRWLRLSSRILMVEDFVANLLWFSMEAFSSMQQHNYTSKSTYYLSILGTKMLKKNLSYPTRVMRRKLRGTL